MAIADLIEAVERGKLHGYATEFSSAFGAYAQHAANAYNDDINAAVALLEAVLPGWFWNLSQTQAVVGQNNESPNIVVRNDNPARALLLAILKALAAKERNDG